MKKLAMTNWFSMLSGSSEDSITGLNSYFSLKLHLTKGRVNAKKIFRNFLTIGLFTLWSMNSLAAASISLTKMASPTTVTAAEQTITYSFAVMNTGSVVLTGVAIHDLFTGTGPPPLITCPTSTLTPAESTTCTGNYTVTQADIDSGAIDNTATASGTPLGGPPVTSGPSSATVTVTQSPALSLAKSALPTTVSTAGQTITYSFLVNNTGNVDLTGITINETLGFQAFKSPR